MKTVQEAARERLLATPPEEEMTAAAEEMESNKSWLLGELEALMPNAKEVLGGEPGARGNTADMATASKRQSINKVRTQPVPCPLLCWTQLLAVRLAAPSVFICV